ncbi:thioesterase family protein [Nocardioides sp. GY 10127]|uniref:thioesterase family protein n=1 Tax=Nocardioides sp. GY 10127 TaxID=2569762 RepID=UPI0010A930F0|nr:thioesterase family protein [Nocardioides sp. GY 10127]TIC82650.1 thioesterase family protein [Nocardioides sp. GY 10127]
MTATTPSAYFVRTGPHELEATRHTGGAWNPAEQHIAPGLGLLVHEVIRDLEARRRDDRMQVSRLAFDITGTVPVGPVVTQVRMLRPGRTVELVEATLSHEGRTVAELRAWLLAPFETAHVAGSHVEPIPGPDEVEPWDASSIWQGDFIATSQVRRRETAPGRALTWVKVGMPLVADEVVSPVAAFSGLLDIANGMSPRVSPQEWMFPNVDLTAHLLREPAGEWLGLDTRVSFGPGGLGVTATVLHDEVGVLGTSTQSLTVRPPRR